MTFSVSPFWLTLALDETDVPFHGPAFERSRNSCCFCSGSQPDALMQSTQMIVVTTPDWNAVEGTLQRYQRGTPQEAWRPAAGGIAIVVGKNGMGWGIGVIATDDPKVRLASDPVEKKEMAGPPPASSPWAQRLATQRSPCRD